MLYVPFAAAATLSVGPSGDYATPCAAIAAAAAGDRIEVDAAGSCDGDTCAWSTDALTIVGVNGRPHLDATGVDLAESKGIFVIHAPSATLENLELSGAAVPDWNGAAIRHQGTDLVVEDCFLHDNEDGILGSPEVDYTGSVTIVGTELARNGHGDGYSHNAYLGHYAAVTLEASWSHDAVVGHLFKSRAASTRIAYSRLTDEGGSASYELDLPEAGDVVVIGSMLEQADTTQNSTMVAFGEEGGDGRLLLVNDTLVNDHGSGTFVSVAGGVTEAATLENVLAVGPGTLVDQAGAVPEGVVVDPTGDGGLRDRAGFDYTLMEGAAAIDAGVTPEEVPTESYAHPTAETTRTVVGAAIDVGAYEVGEEGVGDSATGGSGDAGDSGGPEDSGGTGKADGGGDGCGCTVTRSGVGAVWVLGLVVVGARRRRG